MFLYFLPSRASKIELFAKIVNDWKPLVFDYFLWMPLNRLNKLIFLLFYLPIVPFFLRVGKYCIVRSYRNRDINWKLIYLSYQDLAFTKDCHYCDCYCYTGYIRYCSVVQIIINSWSLGNKDLQEIFTHLQTRLLL